MKEICIMNTRLIWAVLATVWATCLLGSAKVDEPSVDHLARLTSESKADRKEAAQAILEAREEVVRKLETIVRKFVRDESRKGTAKTAIVLLGKLRSAGSVGLLAENLTFGVFYKSTKRPQPPEDFYPCVGALSEIGKPSVGAMLRNLETSQDEKVRKLSARVIRNVEGPALARIVLEKAAQKQTDPAKQAMLQAALAYFETPKEKKGK